MFVTRVIFIPLFKKISILVKKVIIHMLQQWVAMTSMLPTLKFRRVLVWLKQWWAKNSFVNVAALTHYLLPLGSDVLWKQNQNKARQMWKVRMKTSLSLSRVSLHVVFNHEQISSPHECTTLSSFVCSSCRLLWVRINTTATNNQKKNNKPYLEEAEFLSLSKSLAFIHNWIDWNNHIARILYVHENVSKANKHHLAL